MTAYSRPLAHCAYAPGGPRVVFALAVVHAMAVSRSTLKRCIPPDDHGRSTADEKDPALPLRRSNRGFLRALPVALVALLHWYLSFACACSRHSRGSSLADDLDASNPEKTAVTREFLRADLRYAQGAQYDTLKIVASGLLVICL